MWARIGAAAIATLATVVSLSMGLFAGTGPATAAVPMGQIRLLHQDPAVTPSPLLPTGFGPLEKPGLPPRPSESATPVPAPTVSEFVVDPRPMPSPPPSGIRHLPGTRWFFMILVPVVFGSVLTATAIRAGARVRSRS